jgi:hypothetical protein
MVTIKSYLGNNVHIFVQFALSLLEIFLNILFL